MATLSYRYRFPDRFICGAVSDHLGRTFFVQVRQADRLTNVRCSKQQVGTLADHVEEVLDELSRTRAASLLVPPVRTKALDREPLDVPLDADFTAGTMTIAYVPADRALMIELFAEGHYEASLRDESAPIELLQAIITPDQARDFVARTRGVLDSTRPSCPFCKQEIRPEGHICPRANGFRRPLFDGALGLLPHHA